MAGTNIVRFGFLLAGLLFLFAAAKPAFRGGSLNATFLVIGVACIVVGAVVGRKPGTPPSAGA
ncbi:MAG: hypothetical protein HYS61_00420 [Acidobacteria bacterium]|nr:hypothetical protein [Acidobacteriota bacterium]